jgi:hypothetical protein
VSTIGTIILRAYIAAIVAAAVLGPMVLLHAYRQWWADLFYAAFAYGVVGGSISHYRITRRNRTN